MLNLPKGRLSISQIETYQRCPMQYYYRYIEERISPPGIALVYGKSVHSAIECTHRHIAEYCRPAPEEEVKYKFLSAFDAGVKDCRLWPDDDVAVSKDSGLDLVEKYNRTHAPYIWPLRTTVDNTPWIEREVSTPVAGVPMMGVIDLIDASDARHDFVHFEICDIKTSKRRKTQADIDSSLQLTYYSYATGINSVRYDVLVNTKDVHIDTLRSTRGQSDFIWLENTVYSVANAISLGVFPPCKSDSCTCSERWCGYWSLCRGKKHA